MTRGRVIRIVLTLAVTGACLAYILWQLNVSRTARILVHSDLGWFAGASFFAKWRSVMLPVTFALLGLAWYLAYRAPNRACTKDGSCTTTRAGKWNKVVLCMATAFVVGTALFPVFSAALVHSAQPAKARPAMFRPLEARGNLAYDDL